MMEGSQPELKWDLLAKMAEGEQRREVKEVWRERERAPKGDPVAGVF